MRNLTDVHVGQEFGSISNLFYLYLGVSKLGERGPILVSNNINRVMEYLVFMVNLYSYFTFNYYNYTLIINPTVTLALLLGVCNSTVRDICGVEHHT